MARGKCGARLFDRRNGLPRSPDAPDFQETQEGQHGGDHDHYGEHEQESHPAPDPGIEQFGDEKEEKEGGVEPDHQRGDEENTAGQSLLDVPGDLGAGQLDLGSDQRRHLRCRVFDQVTDRRLSRSGVRVGQRNRGQRAGHTVLAIDLAHRRSSRFDCSARPRQRRYPTLGRHPARIVAERFGWHRGSCCHAVRCHTRPANTKGGGTELATS